MPEYKNLTYIFCEFNPRYKLVFICAKSLIQASVHGITNNLGN